MVQHRQLILNQDEKGCGYLFQIDSCREHDERKKWFQTNHQGLTTLNGFSKCSVELINLLANRSAITP